MEEMDEEGSCVGAVAERYGFGSGCSGSGGADCCKGACPMRFRALAPALVLFILALVIPVGCVVLLVVLPMVPPIRAGGAGNVVVPFDVKFDRPATRCPGYVCRETREVLLMLSVKLLRAALAELLPPTIRKIGMTILVVSSQLPDSR